ncbi:NAD(+)/NADH kinase, partial [Pseudoalteromonas ruthenica]
RDVLEVYTVSGEMGEELAKAHGFTTRVVMTCGTPTTPEDTEQAARLLAEAKVDLLLFAGGDGTARNICSAIG